MLKELMHEYEKDQNRLCDDENRRLQILKRLGFSENITYIEYDNKLVQVMRRSICLTLLEKINSCSEPEAEKVTIEILTMLAFIHAKMPVEGKSTRKSREYFDDRVGRLKQEYDIDAKIIDKLLAGYIVDARINSEYVFNKDAHPENWIIETGLIPKLRGERIIAIDWDEKGTIEQAQELFTLKYLNSVYERAIALCFAWSSPSRPRIQPLRAQILGSAMESIDIIKREYREFYIYHCTEFVRRDTGLKLLRDYFMHN